MKQRIYYFLALIIAGWLFHSCNEAAGHTNISRIDRLTAIRDSVRLSLKPVTITPSVKVMGVADLPGNWVGYVSFVDTATVDSLNLEAWTLLNLKIDSVIGNQIFAKSLFMGKEARLSGTFTLIQNTYLINLVHKDDGIYDGVFNFSISANDTVMKGSWDPYRTSVDTWRDIRLSKRLFSYNPSNELGLDAVFIDWNKYKTDTLVYFDDYEQKEVQSVDELYFATTEDLGKMNASKDLLPVKFVENLKKGDIFILRNSIFARHGFAFPNPQLAAFFGEFDWYVPVHEDVSGMLTDTELRNIELLLRYEDHAEEFYDAFGR